jgi:hypothetical protein
MHTTTLTSSLSGRTTTGGRLDIGTLAERCASGEPPPPATVRLDELEPGFTRSGSGWRNALLGYGGHHYWLLTRDSPRQSYGTWRPQLERGGSYKILARIPAQTMLSRQAIYRIRTSGGWVERTRNQAKNRGTWMKLGIFSLTSSPTVRLTDATGEGGARSRRLVFDALRFVPSTSAARTASRERTPAEGGDPRAESVPRDPEPSLEPGPSAVPSAAPPGTAEPQPTPEDATPAPADGGEPSVPERRPVDPTPEPRASDAQATPAPRPAPSGLPASAPGDEPGGS